MGRIVSIPMWRSSQYSPIEDHRICGRNTKRNYVFSALIGWMRVVIREIIGSDQLTRRANNCRSCKATSTLWPALEQSNLLFYLLVTGPVVVSLKMSTVFAVTCGQCRLTVG